MSFVYKFCYGKKHITAFKISETEKHHYSNKYGFFKKQSLITSLQIFILKYGLINLKLNLKNWFKIYVKKISNLKVLKNTLYCAINRASLSLQKVYETKQESISE